MGALDILADIAVTSEPTGILEMNEPTDLLPINVNQHCNNNIVPVIDFGAQHPNHRVNNDVEDKSRK